MSGEKEQAQGSMVRPLALKALGAALGSQWEPEPGGLWMTDVLAGWWNQGLSSYLGHYIYRLHP